MRVAVVGGGAAGLTSAWLLEQHHEVTLFERDDRLGGHAQTIDVDAHGQRTRVDAGFQFFAPGAPYTSFNRLLDLVGVRRESYAASLTVYDVRSQHPLVMPPFRGIAPRWSSLTPASLRALLRFRSFLGAVPAFLTERDTSLTIGEYLERQRLPKSFVDEVLLPILLSFWCVDRAEFLGFAAYNALYYLGANATSGLRAPTQSAIPGGMRTYVDALAASLERAEIRTDAAVRRVRLRESVFGLELADGSDREFDRVVLACNPRQAGELIDGIRELSPITEQLRRFETFDTTIAIHGDRRLMPADEAAWSVVNARWDGEHSSLTVWDARAQLPVFKSWITFDAEPPEPLYATATYEHARITPTYFEAQEALRPLNGRHGLWLAGLSTHDVDSHESAVRSAITVASALAPDSRRLHALTTTG